MHAVRPVSFWNLPPAEQPPAAVGDDVVSGYRTRVLVPSQLVQLALPAVAAMVPAAHALHSLPLVDPSRGFAVPAGHASQPSASVAAPTAELPNAP